MLQITTNVRRILYKVVRKNQVTTSSKNDHTFDDLRMEIAKVVMKQLFQYESYDFGLGYFNC